MADVLIVCVREDEPQAKALAEMFEAAGFTIGGAPSSDGALRSSGAGVVVWSHASIRSRPFLDAAQRVINADKAVVASLIEPPPPSSVGNSPTFDLADWNGDPNDPSLDPLFFAVDRMVNSQRAAAGAVTEEEAPPAYEPPAPRAPAPPRAAAPSPRQAAPASRGDVLQSESEHWRAIRDSRNPADFMDYLARYGPDGAFSEVAELRLKQLTAAPERGQPRPRMEAPARQPQRREPSVRPPPPPPRRVMETPPPPPPPPRRLDPPRAQPAFDRAPGRGGYNERPELREPPKGEGGPLRAFVLIALLGGIALAGGLYFGNGGLPNLGQNANQQSPEPTSAPPSLEPPSANETSGTSLSQLTTGGRAAAPAPAPAPVQRRQEPPPRAAEPLRNLNAAASPPRTNTANAGGGANSANSGGPIQLLNNNNASTRSQQGAATPLAPAPLPPSTLTAMNNAPPSLTGPAPQTIVQQGSVRWASRPTARRIADLYPSSASRLGVGGRVELNCTVASSLGLSCVVASETPSNLGFGRAALSVANAYRALPALSDGSGAVGTRTRIAVQFQAPPQ